MTELNTNHLRAVFHRFEAIDQALCEMECELHDVSGNSPFRNRLAGLTGADRQAAGLFSESLRVRMEAILAALGAPPRPRTVDAARAVRPFLTGIEILIEELRPARMKGYGKLSAEAARELEAIATELQARVAEFEARLTGFGAGAAATETRG